MQEDETGIHDLLMIPLVVFAIMGYLEDYTCLKLH